MNSEAKKQQLKQYKTLATGLFFLMLIVFVLSTIYFKKYHLGWIGYVKAFSEAAMVGALADWFAVTALFHYPLGIKIPHTNLIEKSKEKIGDNLGNFVVENFLTPENIRPYIMKLQVSQYIGEWLSKEKNQEALVDQFSSALLDIINKLDDKSVIQFIEKKAIEMSSDFKINDLIGNGIEYILDKNDHQRMITSLSHQIKNYIIQHQDNIEEQVEKGSYSFIPKFVDRKIAEKITSGLTHYFEEVEEDENNNLRKEITSKLYDFAESVKHDPQWEAEFTHVKNDFLKGDKMHQYARDIWETIKKTITKELAEDSSGLKKYLFKNIGQLADNLKHDEKLQNKIDSWVRLNAYRYILKNASKLGELISTTVGNWEGRELSNKLELEVGKDLQFIRINGTVVGGIVGLLIYTLSQLL